MLTAVVAEGVAIVLLGVLVLGLLRSHALILKALHELGAGLELEREAGASSGQGTGPVHVDIEPGVVRAERPPSASATAPDVVGRTLDGAARAVRVTEAGSRTLLAFLTSGCSVCATFWDAFADPVAVPGGAGLVAVVKGDAEESPSALRRLAPPALDLVRSDEAWADYDVPGSPYFVLVEAGRIVGEGSASTWPQVRDLLGQAVEDAGLVRRGVDDGTGAAGVLDRGERDEPSRMDAELRAAGITPGHPSLYPQAPGRDPHSAGSAGSGDLGGWGDPTGSGEPAGSGSRGGPAGSGSRGEPADRDGAQGGA
ncbi:hypothetical protein BN12_410013 [Nostocoides japonicum T1-X7]|uniref:Thioredoxin domain-containing protein n=1 Tax=Nostocoides japonicum T1-X7 TaxID=1194083 RepID=A0A077M088_9MICO|nr:hypothetical protein [Tetrasphaera japonica]CCH79256.1 hypothetical protein BN12_410013 [Tetrasphaera japonica T1-X7]